jgi:hypothetical protein
MSLPFSGSKINESNKKLAGGKRSQILVWMLFLVEVLSAAYYIYNESKHTPSEEFIFLSYFM